MVFRIGLEIDVTDAFEFAALLLMIGVRIAEVGITDKLVFSATVLVRAGLADADGV